MKQFKNDRFDEVMKALRKPELSKGFDAAFKKRLLEAHEKKLARPAWEKFLNNIYAGAEDILYNILPKAPALVPAALGIIIFIMAGAYIYSVQPALPIVVAKKGSVFQYNKILKPGSIIKTGQGSELDIDLSDKYAMRLKENSALMVASLTPRYGNGKARFELLEGKVLVSVEKGFKGSQFEVDTKTARAVALGTKFVVDVNDRESTETKVSVAQGKVRVEGRYLADALRHEENMVTVSAGQKTQVGLNSQPQMPQRFVEREWLEMEELYQIGKKARVVLLIKNTPSRTEELLKPCPIYISDERPREIPRILERAIVRTAEAIKTGDSKKHLESIKLLESIVEKHSNPSYDVQFLLYIGAYYEYLSRHDEAIKAFEKVLARYPESYLASIAQCAIGIVYERTGDKEKAKLSYEKVLESYPNSIEAIWVEEKLGIKKLV